MDSWGFRKKHSTVDGIADKSGSLYSTSFNCVANGCGLAAILLCSVKTPRVRRIFIL
jgi:hypothetical protein